MAPTQFDTSQFREFLLKAAHDLRSPIRSVRTGAELLQSPEKRSGDDLNQILSFMMEGAKKLDSLVDGLSGLALALGCNPETFRPVRIDATVRSAIARLAGPIRESGAEVKCSELPAVSGDPDRLVQLFEHLLRNALQHGGKRPGITIGAERAGDYWLVTVQDNGPGVEPEYLERIFRPFERMRTGPSSGPGLGLAISREIVARHGGEIRAESKAGSGMAVRFTLPVVD